jgi:hypothetical protein
MDAIFSEAVEVLKQSLQTMETNAPINRAERNNDQADLEDRTAASIRAALERLSE